MDYKQLKDVQNEFISISNYLLESTEATFTANLSSFKEFCDTTSPIPDIINSISSIPFNGTDYFCNKSNPSLRFEQYKKPKNHKEFVKVAYDVLWDDELNANTIINYATWALYPDTKWIDEILSIGINDIAKQLIDYISLELTKLINKEKIEPSPNQINFSIQNAHDSIIGTQTNATINNGFTFDEIEEYIQSKNIDSSDKEKLLELNNFVKTLAENNVPLSKGILNRFSDIIAKHSWVLSLIGSALIKHFIG